jgi:hypothetical protein
MRPNLNIRMQQLHPFGGGAADLLSQFQATQRRALSQPWHAEEQVASSTIIMKGLDADLEVAQNDRM